ncbi:MAG: hypothetical protein D6B27_07105 [Gammaproteobacteria bacterium]|nr:MAG: hypothetical protein D6B27_07105 [Gammaproteobacteria bacterium]
MLKGKNQSSFVIWRQLFKSTLVLSILVIVAVIYSYGLQGPFVLDDRINVLQAVISEPSLEAFTYAATSNLSGFLGRSVSAVTFAISSIWAGVPAQPYIYKLHNLIIHLVCGLGILAVINLLLNYLDASKSKTNFYISLCVMSAWLIHPLSVSTVLYVVQRMAQLSSLFSILALLMYCIARCGVVQKKIVKFVLLFLLIPLFMLLGALSKESAATMILLLAITELCVFRFDYTTNFDKKSNTAFLWVLIIVPLILGSGFLILNTDKFLNYSGREFDLWQRILTQIHVLPYYLKMILMPDLSDMGLFHDDFPVQTGVSILTVIYLLIFFLLFCVGVKLRKKHPIIIFGFLWFFACHAIESTIFPLELVFEHRNYLALMGPLLVVIYLVSLINDKIFLSGCTIAILILIGLTKMRVEVWGDEQLLYYYSVKDHPESIRANIYYSNVLAEKGEYSEAKKYIENILDDEMAGVYMHLAVLDCHLDGADTANYMKKAENNISNVGATPYVLSNFRMLVRVVEKNICPGMIDNAQVKKLMQKFIAGGGKKSGVSYYYLGQVEFLDGDPESGKRAFIKAYELVRDATVPQVLSMLLQRQIQMGLFEEGWETIALAREFSEQTRDIAYYIKKMESFYMRKKIEAENSSSIN